MFIIKDKLRELKPDQNFVNTISYIKGITFWKKFNLPIQKSVPFLNVSHSANKQHTSLDMLKGYGHDFEWHF